ncbi:MAG: hypothetical protein CLLPBCKN_001346 [Chroococcidiopsis cubana SAG 39.79]|uniref:Ribbon-helix-helix protein CopG domain-containing protein n=1 Tax=Chroococcidiopsis cubana SAG 39.79 TaxID=388085 RepID=A0AB37UC30_9CYAN|nr:hypothetical protein [Chroococcidiopsis cubana SAG 39.79]PSB64929.1 hypothetical protein C7B79_07580 [Chroococcidiopsis cubana CCALA 043]RUT05377.1 hypothetical protein DSM107010_55300 [Chroococcidiopsis cubana SAG 39.79]
MRKTTNEYSVQRNVHLPVTMVERVSEIADEEKVSFAEIVRRAIAEYLSKTVNQPHKQEGYGTN